MTMTETMDIKSEEGFTGIITKGVGGLYGVRPLACGKISNETVMCRARGVFRHDKVTPLPGDIVQVSAVVPEDTCDGKTESVSYVIEEIEPRKNSLVRPAIANLTHLFAVIPAARPAPDLVTADKLISISEDKGIEAVIIVSKSDADAQSASEIEMIYKSAGYDAFAVSNETGEGINLLEEYIKRQSEKGHMIAAFAGVSGAGKSTLMTALFPTLELKSGDISRKIQRGRHTTRHAELYPVTVGEGVCFVADTPGFSMLDFTRFDLLEADKLPCSFREFAPLMGSCRYTKCTHTKEEGCAVIEKVNSGEISKSRHESYCRIFEEIRKNPEWKRRK